jgi:hypothetical protein
MNSEEQQINEEYQFNETGISISESCFDKYVRVDGVDFKNLPNKREFLKSMLDGIPDESLSEILELIVDYNKEYVCVEGESDACEQCGNYNWFRRFEKNEADIQS